MVDAFRTRAGEEFKKVYPVNIEERSIGGVPTRVVTPLRSRKADVGTF